MSLVTTLSLPGPPHGEAQRVGRRRGALLPGADRLAHHRVLGAAARVRRQREADRGDEQSLVVLQLGHEGGERGEIRSGERERLHHAPLAGAALLPLLPRAVARALGLDAGDGLGLGERLRHATVDVGAAAPAVVCSASARTIACMRSFCTLAVAAPVTLTVGAVAGGLRRRRGQLGPDGRSEGEQGQREDGKAGHERVLRFAGGWRRGSSRMASRLDQEKQRCAASCQRQPGMGEVLARGERHRDRVRAGTRRRRAPCSAWCPERSDDATGGRSRTRWTASSRRPRRGGPPRCRSPRPARARRSAAAARRARSCRSPIASGRGSPRARAAARAGPACKRGRARKRVACRPRACASGGARRQRAGRLPRVANRQATNTQNGTCRSCQNSAASPRISSSVA